MSSTVASALPTSIHLILTNTSWDVHFYSHVTLSATWRWSNLPRSSQPAHDRAGLESKQSGSRVCALNFPLRFLNRPAGAFWGLGQAQMHLHVKPCDMRLVCTSHVVFQDSLYLCVNSASLSQSHAHPPACSWPWPCLAFSPSPAGGPHSNP